MRLKTSISVFWCFYFINFPALADQANRERKKYELDWEAICTKFDQGAVFRSEATQAIPGTEKSPFEPILNYAIKPNQTMILLPEDINIEKDSKIEVDIERYERGDWQYLLTVQSKPDPKALYIGSDVIKGGFLKLRLKVKQDFEQTTEHTLYAIISDNWKKDILEFCRDLKEQVEINPDVQLVRSSIATSHFDHTMEIISQNEFLTGEVLRALIEAVKSKNDFDMGKCPDLVIGFNELRLRRFEGAPIHEFVVRIPEDYDESKSWPVFLHTDRRLLGTAQGFPSAGIINIWWYSVRNENLVWDDFETLKEIIEQKVNIDQEKICLTGDCGGGIEAMALALKYPDQWAGCYISLGNAYREMAGNALNLPLFYIKGLHNKEDLVAYYNFAVKCFQYYGCKYFRHSTTSRLQEICSKEIKESKYKRIKRPDRILYTIESLDNPSAYWIEIVGREDENLTGMIDVTANGQSVYVKTNNIDAYILNLARSPVDSNKPVQIFENGRNLGIVTSGTFIKKPPKYDNVLYAKNKHLHGPIWDVFNNPYVVVWGASGKDKTLNEASKTVAKSLAKDGPCVADINLPAEQNKTHNLVLVGTTESNLWPGKIHEKLPVKIKDGKVWANGRYYDGKDVCFIIIYPNPLNPDKYAALFSGTSLKAIGYIPKIYSELKSARPADVGIFEITKDEKVKWHIFETFNTVWGWHEQWDEVLAAANKIHPDWQWYQLIARAVREELKADVSIIENPFYSKDFELQGQITYRDLFNSFRNDWIIKICLSGRNLKEILTVPFNDISKREIKELIVDGITFGEFSKNSEERNMAIGDIENDKKYVIAAPYKAINGQRTGIILNDYEIIEEGHLIPLLRCYLRKNRSLDIDVFLDSFQKCVF